MAEVPHREYCNALIPANGFNALVVTIIDGKAQDSMVPDVFALWPEWQEKYAKRWGTAEGARTEGEQGVPECYPEPHLADGSLLFNAPCMKAAAAAAVSASGKSTFVDVVVGLQPIKSEDFPYFPIDDNDVRDDTSTSTRCACSSPEMSKPLKSSWPPPRLLLQAISGRSAPGGSIEHMITSVHLRAAHDF